MVHENNGYKCEQYVADKFRKLGAEVHIRNLYYDLEVNFSGKRTRKIEIKSCKFQTQSGLIRKFGRFDFKYKNNLNKIKKTKVWLCFVVYVENGIEIIGFLNPNKISSDKRFYSLCEIINIKTMSWETFVNRLKIDKWNK